MNGIVIFVICFSTIMIAVGCFELGLIFGKMNKEVIPPKYEQIVLQNEQTIQKFLNLVNPKSYRDNVTIHEDQDHYYITHSENFTYGTFTGNRVRIKKGEHGKLLLDKIEGYQ